MDFFQFLFYFVIICFIVTFLAICVSDADLSLRFCELFCNKLHTLKGQVIWITGASTGIGAAVAVEAAKHGAKLVISARSTEKLEEVKKKCLESGRYEGLTDKDVLVLPMDMCDFDSHKGCLDKVLAHFGKLSIMFHNAGRSQRARWEHTDLGVDREVFDLNVFSVVNLTRLVIPHFLAQGGGTFSVVSSMTGKLGAPFSGTYTGSKHALHGYFESLRNEKLGTGIEVTMLCPGPVFSNLLAIAATEKPQELFSGEMSSTDRRMSTERCAYLCLVATANKLEETWITFFPILPLFYIGIYFPTLSKRFVSLVGPRFMQKLRDSKETVKSK